MMKQEEVWDEIARKWGEFRVVISNEVKEFLKDKKGKLLDVGCGSGRNFIRKEGLTYYGIDFSKEMLLFAKNKAEKLNIQVELKKANSWKIPYNEAYFDTLLCYSVLHCVETKEKRITTIKELYRVLKKDGRVLISVWSGKGPRINKYKEVNETHIPWTVNGKKYERYTYIYKKEELEKILEEEGFTIEKSWEDRNINIIARK